MALYFRNMRREMSDAPDDQLVDANDLMALPNCPCAVCRSKRDKNLDTNEQVSRNLSIGHLSDKGMDKLDIPLTGESE